MGGKCTACPSKTHSANNWDAFIEMEKGYQGTQCLLDDNFDVKRDSTRFSPGSLQPGYICSLDRFKNKAYMCANQGTLGPISDLQHNSNADAFYDSVKNATDSDEPVDEDDFSVDED